MKNLIFKIITLTTILSCVIGCTCLNKQSKDITFSTATMKAETYYYNDKQIDSLCVADTLARDLEDWIASTYTDYETNKRVTKYTYTKYPSTFHETAYILTKQDTLYKVIKRYITIQ